MTHDMQTREVTFRAETTPDGRTITAIGVPYDSETEIVPGIFESFAPGSIDDSSAILRYAHREPIGRIEKARDTPAGREIVATISHTPRGDEIATLVSDRVLKKMSVGFYPDESTETTGDDGARHIRHTKVNVVEYSVVEFPAYQQADIENIRSLTPRKDAPMSETESALTGPTSNRSQAPLKRSSAKSK